MCFFIFAHLRTPSVAFTNKWLPKSKKTQVFHRFLSDLDFKRLQFISQIQAQLYQGNIGDFEGGKT